jgi:AAA domain
MQVAALAETPRRSNLYDLLDRRTFALPTSEESLATPLSDDLIFNWTVHAEETPPTVSVEHLAWDLRWRCGAERGLELFRPIVEAWGNADTIKDVWAAADRPERESDQHIIYELAGIHNQGDLLDLMLADHGESVRNELDALADRFETLQFEMTKEAFAVHPAAQPKGRLFDPLRKRFATLAQEQFARDMKAGKIPMPSNVVPLHPAAPVTPADPALEAPQPFVWRDPSTIPMMPWIYGKHLLRGCVSLTVAPSGVGKTFQKVMETVAMITGRMLLHDKPAGQLRCWLYNGEEPMEILERRFQAAFLHHKLKPADVGDRLFVNDRKTKMVIARQTRDGVMIVEPVKDLLISYIRANQIDVLSIDPFVSAHAVTENDNVAIDQVVKAYADVAQETNCAIDLVHHSRKTNGSAVGIEDARGASAAIGAVRAARTLNFMSPEEAARAGVKNRFRYVRIDDAKPNHAPRSESAQWVQFQGVYLGNGPMGLAGDNVAAMVRWEWPDAMAGVTSDGLQSVWGAVRAGSWRESSQAADWVGKPIAGALGLDLDKPADKAKVKGMVHRLIKSGELVKVEGLDERRHSKIFIEVGIVQVTPHSAPPPPAHP